MKAKATKLQKQKIKIVLLLLKAKFNAAITKGEFQQAIGIETAITLLQEHYSNELKENEKETTN